jgi:hypothetical protein
MFRLLKEALTTPERPTTANPTSQQPQPFPTRLPVPPSSQNTGQESSKSIEEDGPALSDEDMLVEDTLEDLGRRTTDTIEDLELTAKVSGGPKFNRLHTDKLVRAYRLCRRYTTC